MSSNVSFTIRRPSPVSRAAPSESRLAQSHDQQQNDSSDEDSVIEDELVTGFDKFGVQRLNEEKKAKKPLVIPALKNKDWRELARKRRNGGQDVPPQMKKQKTIPVVKGLDVVEEETEDQKALRAILAETNGETHDGSVIDIIPIPISEADALKQDVDELPDAATLEDYARVPVSQFGAALLRGMGWTEGTSASRKPGKGLIEPYLPSARPALLGLGAKEQEVFDDGSRKGGKSKRPDRRYVPVVKRRGDARDGRRDDERDGSESKRDRSRESSRRR